MVAFPIPVPAPAWLLYLGLHRMSSKAPTKEAASRSRVPTHGRQDGASLWRAICLGGLCIHPPEVSLASLERFCPGICHLILSLRSLDLPLRHPSCFCSTTSALFCFSSAKCVERGVSKATQQGVPHKLS